MFTSYGDLMGTNTLNQVEDLFNGFGQLVQEYQSHSGAVTGSTPSVQYAYSYVPGQMTNPNHSRLVSMTYPNGRILHYGYNTGLDDSISRLSFLADDDGMGGIGAHLEDLTYLGLSTVVQRLHQEDGINLSYINTPNGSTDAGDQYNGLDRFGRVIDQYWASTSTVTDDFSYGYDRDGNRLYRANNVHHNFDELYHASGPNNGYDGFNQLTNFERGVLSASQMNGPLDTIVNATHSQSWNLDVLGNWSGFNSDSASQTRSHNVQNQITSLTGGTGGHTPGYDNNGNTTQNEFGNALTYDAWNRLVQVKNGILTLNSYVYDALGRRIRQGTSINVRDQYFSSQWQVLEERQNTTTTAQYVWSPVYVDAMVERDSGGTRLYVQQDANYNVTAVVNTAGSVQERYVYDPYGTVTIYDPTWMTIRPTSQVSWIYLHQGGRYDAAVGLYNFRNRDYSPTLGRWMEEDPIRYREGSADLYLYLSNGPTTDVDPTGLEHFNGGPGQLKRWQKDIDSLRAMQKAWERNDPKSPGFKICQRDIKADDSCDRAANCCGGQHTYIQNGPVDKSGKQLPGTKGVGWAGGKPAWEDAFRPSSCSACTKTTKPLPYGMGTGTPASKASDEAILDCLKNYPPRQPFKWNVYNCRSWAKDASSGCGLSCNTSWTPADWARWISGSMSAGSTCFVAGTLVHTSKGNVPIEAVRVGDNVLSWSEKEARFEFRPVTGTIRGEATMLVEFRVDKWLVRCSPTHRFLMSDSCWKTAQDFKCGDSIRASHFQLFRVTETRSIDPNGAEKVYNLEVDENHNYCVASPGLLTAAQAMNPNTAGRV